MNYLKLTIFIFDCVNKKLYISKTELFKIELLDHLIVWLMFNWIVSDTSQYLEPFNFINMLNCIVWNNTVFTFNCV